MNGTRYEVQPDPFWAIAKLVGDGYDRMDAAIKHGWFPIPCWGRDGWDLGDWPYSIVYARDSHRGFELAQDVEGDITHWVLPTPGLRTRLIDAIALHRWRSTGAAWLEATLPEEITDLLGPYRAAPDQLVASRLESGA